MYDTLVDEIAYTTLQDDGCPNCPEHLGDRVQLPTYVIRPTFKEWLSIDNEVLNAMRHRNKMYNDIIGYR